MHLQIDTSHPNIIKIKLNGKEFIAQSKRHKAQYLLEFMDDKLKESGNAVADIKKITINKGPGSFTGLRVGATIAGTLGWSLGITVDIELQLV